MADLSPPLWLRSAHVQSVYPSFPLRRRGVLRRAAPLLAASREIILDCGEGVRLMGLHTTQAPGNGAARPSLVVLLHGWEGSADSLYVLTLGQYLYERGYDIFRLNLRDHGPTHHLNRELFHSCRLPEVVGAVQRIQSLFPAQRLSLVGFSLGGNFALRVGSRARTAGIRLHKIVAISPVLDPAVTLDSLEHGVFLYRRYFVWKWQRSLIKKQLAWPDLYDFGELMRRPSLRWMTDHLVRKYTEYPDLKDYLRGYSIVHGMLETLETPSRIITAQDDPMIPTGELAQLPRNPAINVTVQRYGGHCGFRERIGGDGWIAHEVLEELR